MELEEQIGKFKVSIGDSMRKRDRSPNYQGSDGMTTNIISYIVRESQSRLVWPKIPVNNADQNYSSREAGRSMNRNDHVSFGDINAINQASANKRMTASALTYNLKGPDSYG